MNGQSELERKRVMQKREAVLVAIILAIAPINRIVGHQLRVVLPAGAPASN